MTGAAASSHSTPRPIPNGNPVIDHADNANARSQLTIGKQSQGSFPECAVPDTNESNRDERSRAQLMQFDHPAPGIDHFLFLPALGSS